MREAVTLMPQAVERGARVVPRRVLQDRERDHLRPAGQARADLRGGGRSAGRQYAGRAGEGFICTSGKAPKLYTETLLPNVAAGIEAAGRAPRRYDRMIEMKVSFDTDRQRAMKDTQEWAALAL